MARKKMASASLITAVLLSAALAVTGCGGSEEGSGTGGSQGSVAKVDGPSSQTVGDVNRKDADESDVGGLNENSGEDSREVSSDGQTEAGSSESLNESDVDPANESSDESSNSSDVDLTGSNGQGDTNSSGEPGNASGTGNDANSNNANASDEKSGSTDGSAGGSAHTNTAPTPSPVPDYSDLTEDELYELIPNMPYALPTEDMALLETMDLQYEDPGNCEHDFSRKLYMNDYPCLSSGVYSIVCKKCGYLDSGVDEEFPHGDRRVVITQEATCGQYGRENIICKICNNVIETNEIPLVSEHTWGESDVEGYKKCSVCGYYEAEGDGYTIPADNIDDSE